DGMAEPAHQLETEPVAPGARQRPAAGGENHGAGEDLSAATQSDRPRAVWSRSQTIHQGLKTDLDAAAAGEGDEPVAHLAGAVRRREELARLRLQDQLEAD